MATLSPVKVYVRSVTLPTCTPFLLTTNLLTPFLSLILFGAGSLQVRVMEVVVRDDTARFCGGPLGTATKEKFYSAAFTDELTQQGESS